MQDSLLLVIVSPEALVFEGRVSFISVSGAQCGELGIAPGHTPLITPLVPGPIVTRSAESDRSEQVFYSAGGLCEIQPETVVILADSAVRADDLDEAAAQVVIEHAKCEAQDGAGTVDTALAQAELAQALAQVKAIRLLKQIRH